MMDERGGGISKNMSPLSSFAPWEKQQEFSWAVALARREHRLVVEAKNQGGDALVCLSANRSFLNTTIYQMNFRNDVAVLVLNYLPEVAPPATANSPTK
jgi:hypothetical protein